MLNKQFLILFLLPVQLIAQNLSGKWYSSFRIAGTAQRIDLLIGQNDKGATVDLVFPDLDTLKRHSTDQVVVNDTLVAFSWTKRALKFDGKFIASEGIIRGEMQQSGLDWEVTFYRDPQPVIEIKRPQEPNSADGYSVREVQIPNGDVALGATIFFPKLSENGKIPLVIMASGSGPQNRDCELMGHKPFLVMADHLAKNGIAVLRFDDRGMGKSTGVFQTASLKDFASDINACVKFIKRDKELGKRVQIGIAGHSEGGMHALMVAAKNKDVRFILELASVGTSGKDVLIRQQYLIPLKAGLSEEYARWNSAVFAGMCRIISNYTAEKVQDPMYTFLDSMYVLAPQEFREETEPMAFKFQIMLFGNNDWMRQFVTFESKDYLKKIKVPILVVNGGQDIQVPPTEALEGYDKHISKRSRAQSKLILAPDLNHLFQKCNTCDIQEYGDLEETVSPFVLDTMTQWIKGIQLD